MDRFHVVTNPVCMGPMGLANLLYGCSQGTTFPIAPQSRTYGACLECGRQLSYDWNRMRIATRPAVLQAPVHLPATGETDGRAR